MKYTIVTKLNTEQLCNFYLFKSTGKVNFVGKRKEIRLYKIMLRRKQTNLTGCSVKLKNFTCYL